MWNQTEFVRSVELNLICEMGFDKIEVKAIFFYLFSDGGLNSNWFVRSL